MIALAWIGALAGVPAAPVCTAAQESAPVPVDPDELALLAMLALGRLEKARRQGTVPPDLWALAAETAGAYQAKDSARAYRLVTRALRRLDGRGADPAWEAACAVNLVLGRRWIEPGGVLEIRLEPLYGLERPLEKPLSAVLTVRSADGRTISTPGSPAWREPALFRFRLETRSLRPGPYAVHLELRASEGSVLAEARRDFWIVPSLESRLKRLRDALDKGAAGRTPWERTVRETLEYAVSLYEKAGREYVGTLLQSARPASLALLSATDRRAGGLERDPIHPERDIPALEALARGALEKTGDLRLAYRSPADGTLLPFRVYAPHPEGADPRPAVVALHGAFCDENTYFEAYPDPGGRGNLFKKLGRERGYLLVCPSGRGRLGGYEGNGAKDVLDVLDRVRELFRIDERRVFLTGHSMGAQGTWALGFRHAERFAALAPVAGVPADEKAVPFGNAPAMPVFFAAGLRDEGVPVESARRWAEIARRNLSSFRYAEYPDDHFSVGTASLPAIFDFFDARGRDRAGSGR